MGPLKGLIDLSAESLRAELPAFTRRNLFHAAVRARGAAMTEAAFDAALRRRLSRGALPGLLPERCRWPPRRLGRGWDACLPKALLLVDRPAIVNLFAASGAVSFAELAVVCVDGTPAPVVAWLERAFQAGHRAPVLYLHDAATVVYPFTLEPFATLLRHRGDGPVVYRDLGLPPLGATGRRFRDPRLPSEELILDLEAIPPATLVRYCAEAARRLAPG
jgi:hypothetical protein